MNILYISKDLTEGRDSINSALSNSDLSVNEVETIKTRTASTTIFAEAATTTLTTKKVFKTV